MTAIKEMTLIFLSSVVAGVVSLVTFLLIYFGVQSMPFVAPLLQTISEIDSVSLQRVAYHIQIEYRFEYAFVLVWFILGAGCAGIFTGVNCLIVLLQRLGVMVQYGEQGG
jgi:hypothetical protein